MPSPIDQRRLCDGANALDVSSRTPQTIDEVRSQLETVSDGIAALQSLDDLGPEANERAERDQQELWKRYERLKKHCKKLEEKEASS
jgi:hypothetical protein